jgi:hypothetical protein
MIPQRAGRKSTADWRVQPGSPRRHRRPFRPHRSGCEAGTEEAQSLPDDESNVRRRRCRSLPTFRLNFGPTRHLRQACLHLRRQASPADVPSLPPFAHRGQYPDAAKGGPARIENEHGIGLPVRHDAGRRYPANPMFRPLPCANRRRIIHADGPIPLDDPASSRRYLPLQGVAGQRFRSISLPHVTPEVLSTFGALTLLDPLGHALEFVHVLGG